MKGKMNGGMKKHRSACIESRLATPKMPEIQDMDKAMSMKDNSSHAMHRKKGR